MLQLAAQAACRGHPLSSNVRPRSQALFRAHLMAKDQRTLDQLLQGVVVTLYPAGNAPQELTVGMTDTEGDTPLHVYLQRNDSWAVHVLLKCGADVNASGDMGETPLHIAAKTATSAVLAALLAAGARESAVSEFGQTPAQLAEARGRASVYREAKLLARDIKRGHG